MPRVSNHRRLPTQQSTTPTKPIYGNNFTSRPHRSRRLARQIRPRSVARGPHPEQIARRLQPRRGPRRRNRPGGRGFHRRLPRHEIFRRGRQGLCPVALRVRRGGGGSHLQIGPGHDCRRSGDVALGARAARRRATPRRTRRHPRDRCGRCGRQAGHQPLVLPPAHGSHAHPRATALVHSR